MIEQSLETDCGAKPGKDSICIGSFVKRIAPHVIVMGFTWEGSDMGETLLTIEFSADKGGTSIVLTHEKIPSTELRQAHTGGWSSTLDSLQPFLAK